MNTSTGLDHRTATPQPSRRTIDAPTRAFHWLLAACFLGAYLTSEGERWRLVHVTLGYTMVGLMAWRVLWGLLGPRHARLSAWWRKAQGWRNLWANRAQPSARLLQNVLLAFGVLALMATIVLTTASGYAVYQEWWDDALEEVHEVAGNTLLALVLGHVGLIVVSSIWRRQNQVMPMVSGRTPGAGQDVVQRNQGWMAALMLCCVLSFWGWQWSQAPTSGGTGSDISQDESVGGAHSGRHHERHHDDDADED